jgi:hypothetical protein
MPLCRLPARTRASPLARMRICALYDERICANSAAINGKTATDAAIEKARDAMGVRALALSYGFQDDRPLSLLGKRHTLRRQTLTGNTTPALGAAEQASRASIQMDQLITDACWSEIRRTWIETDEALWPLMRGQPDNEG